MGEQVIPFAHSLMAPFHLAPRAKAEAEHDPRSADNAPERDEPGLERPRWGCGRSRRRVAHGPDRAVPQEERLDFRQVERPGTAAAENRDLIAAFVDRAIAPITLGDPDDRRAR